MKVYRFFDWAALVDKFGGDEEFVRSLLGVTLRASSSLPMELRNACAAADFATLAGLAHKVKGTAGDIVATALQFQARDAELAARAGNFAALAQNHNVKACLTLSAGAQAGLLADAIARFGVYSPSCCVLTKLDEASSLGGTISALVKHGLPISYVSDGQRIPEDLNPARAHQLVSRAVQLTRIAGATAGEDLLTRRFGGLAHGIA